MSPPAPAALEALVRAVTDERHAAIEVAADNTRAAWIDAPRAPAAAARGTVVAVVCQPDILALDLDPDPDRHGTDTATFDDITRLLQAGGHHPVVIASGRHGHRHLFCRLPQSANRRHLEAIAARNGIDVRTGMRRIRPPGVRHRAGHQPELLTPDSWEDAAEALAGPEETWIDRALASLDPRLAELITAGDRDHRYAHPNGRVDGSRLTMAICCLATNTGADPDLIYTLLEHPTHTGGEALRRRPERGRWDRRTWFEHTWAKAQRGQWRRRTPRDRSDAAQIITELQAAAAAATFPGRTGATDRIVLAATHRIAAQWGGPVGPLAIRAVAEEAGVNADTAGRALRRLQQAGWLRLVRCSEATQAARWSLEHPPGTPVGARESVTGSAPSGGVGLTESVATTELALSSHDGFAHGALGKSGVIVYAAIRSGHHTPAQIAHATGLHPGTIRRRAAQLARFGLILRSASGHCELPKGGPTPGSLDSAAESCGTGGRARRRRARHADQRVLYRRHLDERAEVAPPGPRPLRLLTARRSQPPLARTLSHGWAVAPAVTGNLALAVRGP